LASFVDFGPNGTAAAPFAGLAVGSGQNHYGGGAGRTRVWAAASCCNGERCFFGWLGAGGKSGPGGLVGLFGGRGGGVFAGGTGLVG
jgi:hypothetical protein